MVGFIAVSGALVFGTFLGIIAGYFGHWVDMIISRSFDILLAFPSILLAIAIVAILGPSLQNALLAIAIINHLTNSVARWTVTPAGIARV